MAHRGQGEEAQWILDGPRRSDQTVPSIPLACQSRVNEPQLGKSIVPIDGPPLVVAQSTQMDELPRSAKRDVIASLAHVAHARLGAHPLGGHHLLKRSRRGKWGTIEHDDGN